VPSQSERRALVLITVLTCLGVVARAGRATRARPEPTSADQRALDAQIARVDSARAAARLQSQQRQRPAPQQASLPPVRDSETPGVRIGLSAPRLTARRRGGAASEPRGSTGSTVDVDRATAAELERLPYVGKVLAGRIAANRDTCGAFGSMDALMRVRGVGEGLARRLAPLVTFSAGSRPMSAARLPSCARAEKRAASRRRDRP
jgi:hypothetical protein